MRSIARSALVPCASVCAALSVAAQQPLVGALAADKRQRGVARLALPFGRV